MPDHECGLDFCEGRPLARAVYAVRIPPDHCFSWCQCHAFDRWLALPDRDERSPAEEKLSQRLFRH